MTEDLLRWIRPEIQQLAAYHVADAEGLIKLDAMENPYTLPSELQQDLQQKLADVALNRYPDPHASALAEALRNRLQVPDGQSIILGNGSDELIQMLAMAVASKDTCLMAFEPGFVMYAMIAEFAGIDYVGVPLDSAFKIDMASTAEAIESCQPAIIFIAYPNNPSANLFDASHIEKIIQMAPGLVVVDEAYHPFAQTSFMPQLPQYENLLVMRTVSKLGLAGLRLGILCGPGKILAQIDKVRLPYNINILTQTAALFVLEHMDVLESQAAEIRQQRTVVIDEMSKMDGVYVFPSQANFVLFRVLNKNANAVFESIRQEGILIKNMKADKGILENCLRVTIGTPDENMAFLSALKKALG